MKQVDFYLISNRVVDAKLKLASRLSNKLQRLDQTMLICNQDQAQADQLNKLMWTYSDTSFVAHEFVNEETLLSKTHLATPEQVNQKVLEREYQVLINLHEDTPIFNHHFTRIAEIVGPDENDKAKARQRYKDYQQQGFEIKTHQVEL